MESVKRVLSSFVVGGCIGLVTQILFFIATLFVGTDFLPAMVVCLAMLGVVTMVLFLCGAYQKIEKVGYFGAVLPFSGLIAAVAHLYLAARPEGGVWAGIKSGMGLLICVLGLGTVFALVIGFVYSLVL